MNKPRKRSRARALWLTILATIFGVAMLLFPLKGRGAPAAAEKPAAKPAAAAAAKGAPKEAPAEPAAAAPEAAAAAEATAATAAAAAAPEETATLPTGRGLPVQVSVAVYFLEVTAFDDAKGEFEATVDVRYKWIDDRLAPLAKGSLRGYREYLGKAAEDQLGKMWSPSIEAKNRTETGSYTGRRLRIFPNGHVETITRTSGKYKAHVDVSSFPFDRQKLSVELISRDDTTDEVLMRFEKEDVEWSRAARTAKLDGWDLGIVDLTRDAVAGWNGDRYSTASAVLFIDRQPASSIASVFIPLIASLLIPLLALWMNKASEDGFEVDAFELANMGIGGLFSVIALSFAIYSSNPVIASTDNTVTRLFGLNYATLAVSLAIVVIFFRYELPKKWFGPYVQREAFHVLSWAIPLLSLMTSVAFLLVAAA